MSSTTLRDFTRRKTLKIIVARHFSSTLLRLPVERHTVAVASPSGDADSFFAFPRGEVV